MTGARSLRPPIRGLHGRRSRSVSRAWSVLRNHQILFLLFSDLIQKSKKGEIIFMANFLLSELIFESWLS